MTIIAYQLIDMDTGLVIATIPELPPFRSRVYVRPIYAAFTRAG